MGRKKIAATALLIAAIPTLRWYALRMQDGGEEVAGLVPLVAALWFWFRDRKVLRAASWEAWMAVVLLLIQAAAYPFLPAILRAVFMIAAVVCFSGILRKPGIVCLLFLALPWTASLDFFLGYPLRLLTSINSEILISLAGIEVYRMGVQLLCGGRVVGVDPACSGMNMLWSTGLLTALLAVVFSLRWRGVAALGIVALVLALAGNSLRAAILFFPEAGLVEMPHVLHAGIGIAISGGCFLVLIRLARKLFGLLLPAVAFGNAARCEPVGIGTARYDRSQSPAVGSRLPHGKRQQATRSPKPAAALCLTIAALLVVVASLFSVKETQKAEAIPNVLKSYQGTTVTRIPLTPAEGKFYGNFPGSIAVYEGEDFKLIVRQVNIATRKLHPASHCLRAEGFRIGEKTVEGKVGEHWLCYTVTRNSETFQVRERISCAAKDQIWPEISAWYWFALFHPGDGPWEAQTVISG